MSAARIGDGATGHGIVRLRRKGEEGERRDSVSEGVLFVLLCLRSALRGVARFAGSTSNLVGGIEGGIVGYLWIDFFSEVEFHFQ